MEEGEEENNTYVEVKEELMTEMVDINYFIQVELVQR